MRTSALALLMGLGLVATPVIGNDCVNSIPPSNPSTSYVDHGDGTATDQRTGLMWKRCSEGQAWTDAGCEGEPSLHTWQESLSIAKKSRFAEHGDWRVPNVRELRSVVELCRVGPAINQTLFPDTAANEFWTASPSTGTPGGAWYVEFHQGMSYSSGGKSSPFRLRLVRTPVAVAADAADSAEGDGEASVAPENGDKASGGGKEPSGTPPADPQDGN